MRKRAEWKRWRVKSFCRVIDKRAGDRRPPLLAVSIHRGVVPRSSITDDEPRAEDLSEYKVCDSGDIVVNRMRAFQGAIGLSEQSGLVSPDYLVLRPDRGVEGRFLGHLFRSHPFVGEMTSRLRGIGATGQGNVRTPRINAEDLGDIVIDLPSIEEQRCIADFLDAEVSRAETIDRTITEGVTLLEERRLAVIDSVMAGVAVDGFVPVKYLSRIVDTEHRTAPHVAGGGYWIASTQAVRQGRLVVSKLYETDEETYRGWTRRATPKPGDVLLSREAPVGEVALYGKCDPPIAIGQRMVLVRPSSYRLDSKFLMWGLLSGRTREYVKVKIQGSLHPHLNMSDIGGISIPIASVDRQCKAADEISLEVARLEAIASAYRRMSGLIAERRQALITAAVTGQIDVATARGVDA